MLLFVPTYVSVQLKLYQATLISVKTITDIQLKHSDTQTVLMRGLRGNKRVDQSKRYFCSYETNYVLFVLFKFYFEM